MTAKTEKTPLLVVCGPSASGKSELAIDLCRTLNGSVTSLDSVQVYRGFDIGSAKEPHTTRQEIAHHLIDVLDPPEALNAAHYLELAKRSIEDTRSAGKLPVIVGGTTMYLSSLLYGLAPMPSADPALRAEVEALGAEQRWEMLRNLDPNSAAKLHPNDTTRVTRAIEAARISGTPLSEHHRRHAECRAIERAIVLALIWPREALYHRINQRTKRMCEGGILSETRAITEKWGKDLPGLRSIGYAESLKVLSGELPEPQLEMAVAQATRRFAKRQSTFLRNEPRKRGWLIRPSENEQSIEIDPLPPGGVGRSRSIKGFNTLGLNRAELFSQLRSTIAKPLQNIEIWYLDARKLFDN